MESKFNIKKSIEPMSVIYFNPNSSDLDDIKILVEVSDVQTEPEEEYNSVRDYIHRIITNSEFLCKNLSPSYVYDAFDEADAVLIIGSKGSHILPNGNIFGFTLIKFNQDQNYLDADVICSHIGIKYAGEQILNELRSISRALFITKIKLKSVNSAIPFYEKYGFVKDSACDDADALCEMTHIVSGSGKRKRKTVRRSHRKKKNTLRRRRKY
jgi:hypothetical protein